MKQLRSARYGTDDRRWDVRMTPAGAPGMLRNGWPSSRLKSFWIVTGGATPSRRAASKNSVTPTPFSFDSPHALTLTACGPPEQAVRPRLRQGCVQASVHARRPQVPAHKHAARRAQLPAHRNKSSTNSGSWFHSTRRSTAELPNAWLCGAALSSIQPLLAACYGTNYRNW